ncbi:MAG: RNA polymerase sigma-70 factor [Bacteroidota bacterium]
MLTDEKYEERKLVLLLSEGSEYAFQLIFDRHRNRVFKLAMLYVKSPAIAEDIVQDVFLKLWFQRCNLNSVINLDSWIYTLTKNHTLNHLKKLSHEWNARGKWAEQNIHAGEGADYKVRSEQYNQVLLQAIAQLTHQQQNVYRLAKESGLSYDAIAQQLSLSPLTVKTHMANALSSIRNFLSSHNNHIILFIFLFIF